MKSGRAFNLLVHPFMMWSRLAWKVGETALESAEVIDRRSNRIFRAD